MAAGAQVLKSFASVTGSDSYDNDVAGYIIANCSAASNKNQDDNQLADFAATSQFAKLGSKKRTRRGQPLKVRGSPKVSANFDHNWLILRHLAKIIFKPRFRSNYRPLAGRFVLP